MAGRRTALSMLAEHGRVHAVATPDDAYAGMLGAWKTSSAAWRAPLSGAAEGCTGLGSVRRIR
ncbi:hypothetical protein [Streptomyces sp. NPDC091027]|uniref:hypothetical protein n=1 Tax=Streptomyces sp. NPDC091027 TaxID=3365971 RepID=UPI003806582B